jgi:hypothetical protein
MARRRPWLWELQGAKSLGNRDEKVEMFDYVQKEGFETNLQLPEDKGDYAYLRAAALDRSGQVLGYTNVIGTATRESATHPLRPEGQRCLIWIWLFIICCASVSAGLSVRLFWRPLCALVQLYRWRGISRSHLRGHQDEIQVENFLADISISSSGATVAAACRPIPDG